MKFGNRQIKDVKIIGGPTENSMKLKELLVLFGEYDFKNLSSFRKDNKSKNKKR